MMIAEAMKLIRPDTDPENGLTKVYLVTRDEDGFEKTEVLGPTIEKIIAFADVATFEVVQSAVEARLEAEYKHLTQRQDLINAARGKVEELMRSYPPPHPVFEDCREAFSRAKEILQLEEQSVGT